MHWEEALQQFYQSVFFGPNYIKTVSQNIKTCGGQSPFIQYKIDYQYLSFHQKHYRFLALLLIFAPSFHPIPIPTRPSSTTIYIYFQDSVLSKSIN